jgi:hypothetical protein
MDFIRVVTIASTNVEKKKNSQMGSADAQSARLLSYLIDSLSIRIGGELNLGVKSAVARRQKTDMYQAPESFCLPKRRGGARPLVMLRIILQTKRNMLNTTNGTMQCIEIKLSSALKTGAAPIMSGSRSTISVARQCDAPANSRQRVHLRRKIF